MRVEKLIYILIIFLIGCNNSPSEATLLKKFNQNKPLLDSIIRVVESDSGLIRKLTIEENAKLPKLYGIEPKISMLLRKIQIVEFSAHGNFYKPIPKWYYLSTNWDKHASVYLTYNQAIYFTNGQDSIQWTQGSYHKDGEMTESWSLGNGWRMIRTRSSQSKK